MKERERAERKEKELRGEDILNEKGEYCEKEIKVQ